jgi:hypothetical protein
MKRCVLALFLGFCLSLPLLGQHSADSPATREDVENYLRAMHSHEMMAQMAGAMSKPLHKMVHDESLKDKDRLPPDFEAHMNKMMDQMFADMPWDEMLQATIPVYQKYFTKGDLEAATKFYASPTGQKMLKQMPDIMADTMDTIMPIMQRQMEKMNQRVRDEIAEMLREQHKAPAEQPARQN